MISDLGLITLFLVSRFICQATAVVCPHSSQWNLRTRARCNSSLPSYNCLYDESTSTYVEFCTRTPDFQRPGYRFIIRGNIDGIECVKNRFQPIKFWTNGSYNCILEKTSCNDLGQVIHDEGNSTSERTCRCDYTNSFAFVTRPKQNCFCHPAREDCSCFVKPCSNFQVMTPDYNCIDAEAWTGIFKCPVITKTMPTNAPERKKTTRCPTLPTDMHQPKNMISVLKSNIALTVTVLTVFSVFIVLVIVKRGRKIMECCRNLHITDKRLLEEIINDQSEFKKSLKEHAIKYRYIITALNTKKVVNELKWITSTDKSLIDSSKGRREQNKALLEIVWNKGTRVNYSFYKKINKKNSKYNLGIMYFSLKEFHERGFHQEMLPKDVKGFFALLEDSFNNEQISIDVRDDLKKYFESWYDEDIKFTVTSATNRIETELKQNNCVLVIGRSGSGKSAIIRHLALKLFNEEGYEIIPMVFDPTTILQYYDPEKKQCFIIDDFCGKLVVNIQTVEMWSLKIKDILQLIKNNKNNRHGSVCFLFATQPFVLEHFSFKRVDCLSEYKLNLSTHSLQPTEIDEMIKTYVPKQSNELLPEISKDYEEILPLICRLSEGKTPEQIVKFFQKPHSIIKQDLYAIKEKNKTQGCLIALCVLFTSLTVDTFRDNTPDKKTIIEVICSEFDLDYSKEPTKLKLQNELTRLGKTLFAEVGCSYFFKHKEIYDIAAVFCGEILTNSFIRFAHSSFIAERYLFKSEGIHGADNINNLICIDDEYTKSRYFNRLMNDLGQGITYSSFHNRQLKNESYTNSYYTYCIDKKQKMMNILNLLTKQASEHQEHRHNYTAGTRIGCINEYEDYIEFTESSNFSSHNMKIPLIESAWEGNVKIVKMLIEMKCDINETDKFGRSALFVGCRRGKAGVVKLLLDQNANYKLCEANGQSPLYSACISGHIEIVESFIQKEAITSQCDENGCSPLHAACAKNRTKIVEKLLSAKTGVNILHCDNLGRSALFVASANGNKEIVQLLLGKGANVDQCDLTSCSPLMAACSKGCLEVVDVMLNAKSQGIEINHQDDEGRSALFMACENGHDQIVEILLQHSASMLCNYTRQTPLFIASSFGHEHVVKLLIENADKMSQVDEEDTTPSSIACEKGKENIVTIVLPKWLSEADDKQRSPLYVACKGGFTEIVENLVTKGAKVDLCNIWKETPLFAASREGHTEVVEYLINKNADLEFAEFNGHTPLWIACEEGHIEIVRILVEKGAEINLLDNDNKTPSDIAHMKGHTKIENILKQKEEQITANKKDVKE